METSNIPAFVRDLANTVSVNGYLSLQELNGRLRTLGWDDFELDDHTLQLIMANFERDGSLSPPSYDVLSLEGLLKPDESSEVSN
jgi:hypothetical protein